MQISSTFRKNTKEWLRTGISFVLFLTLGGIIAGHQSSANIFHGWLPAIAALAAATLYITCTILVGMIYGIVWLLKSAFG
jgi:hypothetical protein